VESGKGEYSDGYFNNKFFFLCFCFIFLFSYVWAEDDVFRHPLRPQNMITFNAISANLAEKPIVTGNFAQEKYLSRFGRSLLSSGNFIISAEQGMVGKHYSPFLLQ